QVMDWGLAKVLSAAPPAMPAQTTVAEVTTIASPRSGAEASLAGAILGTPAYMAPEQARGDIAHVDERSDVFGLGAILCVILTGQPPYAGVDPDVVKWLAMTGDLSPTLARLEACGADPELIALARQCLAPRPGDRPASAEAVASAVSAYQNGVQDKLRR